MISLIEIEHKGVLCFFNYFYFLVFLINKTKLSLYHNELSSLK